MVNRRTMVALGAALAVCLGTAATADHKTHRLALQVSDNSPEQMNAALNIASNVSRYYDGRGEEVEIEIIAFNAGLHMLRADTSPVKERLTNFRKSMTNVSFKACGNTMDTMAKNEGRPITLLPEIDIVEAGVTRLIELNEHGWAIVRP